MYRDERAGLVARLETALQERAAVWDDVTERQGAVVALNEQLAARRLDTVAAPEVDPPGAAPEVAPESKLTDLVRWAGEVEADTARLRTAVADLSFIVQAQNDVLTGRRSERRLGPPPRPVPWLYGVAELCTWWLPVVAAAGALAVSDPGALGLGAAVGMATLVAVALVASVLMRASRWMILPNVFVVMGAAAAAVPAAAVFEASPGASLSPLLVVASIAVFLAVSVAGAVRRVRFLATCRVVESSVEKRQPTSSQMTNWPVRYASGWRVVHEGYTGGGVQHVVRYVTPSGAVDRLVIRGLYEDGVILHDGARAMSLEWLGSEPTPDPLGRWRRRLSLRVGLRVAAGAVALAGFVVALVRALI